MSAYWSETFLEHVIFSALFPDKLSHINNGDQPMSIYSNNDVRLTVGNRFATYGRTCPYF